MYTQLIGIKKLPQKNVVPGPVNSYIRQFTKTTAKQELRKRPTPSSPSSSSSSSPPRKPPPKKSTPTIQNYDDTDDLFVPRTTAPDGEPLFGRQTYQRPTNTLFSKKGDETHHLVDLVKELKNDPEVLEKRKKQLEHLAGLHHSNEQRDLIRKELEELKRLENVHYREKEEKMRALAKGESESVEYVKDSAFPYSPIVKQMAENELELYERVEKNLEAWESVKPPLDPYEKKMFERIQAAKQGKEELSSETEQADTEADIEADEEDVEIEVVNEEIERRIQDRKDKVEQILLNFREGTISLPQELCNRIKKALKSVPKDLLRNEAVKLSNILRARTTTPNHHQDLKKLLDPFDLHAAKEPINKGAPPKFRDMHNQDSYAPAPPTYTNSQALAYVVHRMPGVYACTHRVYSELYKTTGHNFKPTSMLDFGSGPGTAIWSARSIWGEELKDILAVEPSNGMTEVSEKILKGFAGVQRRRFLFTGKGTPQYDLVTASYVLSELKDEEEQTTTMRNLWKATKPGGVMVIVEPGTPIGFGIVNKVRDIVLNWKVELFNEQQGLSFKERQKERYDLNSENNSNEEDETLRLIEQHTTVQTQDFLEHDGTEPLIIAPCPHSQKCPMKNGSWCHFPQRVERIALQKIAKPYSSINWEDEKFSYLVVRKVTPELKEQVQVPKEDQWAKLTATPIKKGGHIIIDTCTPAGEIKRQTVARSHGKGYYFAARKASWGDGFMIQKLPYEIVPQPKEQADLRPNEYIDPKRPWRRVLKGDPLTPDEREMRRKGMKYSWEQITDSFDNPDLNEVERKAQELAFKQGATHKSIKEDIKSEIEKLDQEEAQENKQLKAKMEERIAKLQQSFQQIKKGEVSYARPLPNFEKRHPQQKAPKQQTKKPSLLAKLDRQKFDPKAAMEEMGVDPQAVEDQVDGFIEAFSDKKTKTKRPSNSPSRANFLDGHPDVKRAMREEQAIVKQKLAQVKANRASMGKSNRASMVRKRTRSMNDLD